MIPLRPAVLAVELAVLLALPAPMPGAAGAEQAETQSQTPPQEERYQFRVTVDLISLSVTVTDTRDRFVTDLFQEDFSVYEDGIRQEIEVFSREDLPLRMVLLLDTSASMDENMTFAQEAAVHFVETLEDDDLAEVMEFGGRGRPTVIQPATDDKTKLTRAIRMTQAGGTTSLYNALYVGLKNLDPRRQDVRRQAIIVLSDGEDTSSIVTLDQVLELAKETDVTIYTISLRRKTQRRGRAFSEAEFVLKQLAENTGGQWFFPEAIRELDSVYGRIATELKSQYNIGYVSNNPKRDGSWRRVVVQTEYPNLLVRTKLGYYAPTGN